MQEEKPQIDQNAMSRQLAVYGAEAQGKLMSMRVFIHGLTGVYIFLNSAFSRSCQKSHSRRSQASCPLWLINRHHCRCWKKFLLQLSPNRKSHQSWSLSHSTQGTQPHLHSQCHQRRFHWIHVLFYLNSAPKTSNVLFFSTITIENTSSSSTRPADKTKSASSWQAISVSTDTHLLTSEMLTEYLIWLDKSPNWSTLLESPDNKKQQSTCMRKRDTALTMATLLSSRK